MGASKPSILVAGCSALFLLFASAFVCVVVVLRFSAGGLGAQGTPPPVTPGATLVPSVQPTSTRTTVDSIRESLTTGNIAFNKPSAMILDETKEVQLLLSPSITGEELKKMVTGEGNIQTNEISVSDYMEATLYGDNFVISNATQRKLVSTRGATEWHWDVTPTKAGKQRLHLTLSAIVNYRDGEKPLEVKSFHEIIEVNVTASQRLYALAGVVGSHLQWIAPSLLIPLTLWLWNRWRKRKKDSEDKGPEDAKTDPAGAADGKPNRSRRTKKTAKPKNTAD